MRYEVNSAQVISEIIDGEAVMINLSTGNYYSLSETGAEIWRAIERAASMEEIVGELSARYDASREDLEAAVGRLVTQLQTEELAVAVQSAGEAKAPAEPHQGDRVAFEEPRLDKHTDMQDLILLDPVHEVSEQGWPHVKADGPEAQAPDRVAG